MAETYKFIKLWRRVPWGLVVALGLVILLRIPSLFEPQVSNDEDITLVVGMAARKGLLLYRDIHDHKPPLIYLMSGIAGSVFWFRAILFSWSLLTVSVFHHLATRLFLKQTVLADWATIVFAVFSTIPLFEGHLVNGEILLILPIMAGFLLAWNESEVKKLRWLAWVGVGLLWSVGILIKVPAGVDLIGLFLALWITANNPRWVLSRVGLILAGVLLPVGGTILYFWAKEAVVVYISSVFLNLFPYITSWTGKSAGSSGLMLRVAFLAIWCWFIYRQRGSLVKRDVWILAWFGFSLFAALLSGRPYPHYLMQVVPAASLVALLVVQGKPKVKMFAVSAISILLLSFVGLKFWWYPIRGYYQGFISYALGQQSREKYALTLEKREEWYPKLLQMIKTTTRPDDRIFIWGNEPGIYVFSKRLPVGRFVVAYTVQEFGAYGEVLRALKQNPPKLIILVKGESEFDQLRNFISDNYIPAGDYGEASVFRRMSPINYN